MIEIKCTADEQDRLLLNFATKEATCPFIGLCRDMSYYRTGMKCRECLENNIKWTITDAKPEKKSAAADITKERFMEIASEVAVDYYKPHSNYENIHEFIMSSGYMALVAIRLLKEEK